MITLVTLIMITTSLFSPTAEASAPLALHSSSKLAEKTVVTESTREVKGSKSGIFKDLLPSDLGYEETKALVERGIITGYSGNKFKPYDNITRQQVAVMLYRSLELTEPHNKNAILAPITDISPNHDYAIEIAGVIDAGVFQGAKGKFNPNAHITREQMASVLVRAYPLKAQTTPVNLTDIKKIDRAHHNNVKVLAQHQITLGKLTDQGERYFDGGGNLNRVQFVMLLHRILELEENKITHLETVEAIERDVIKLTNREREKLGLVPLRVDTRLGGVAREKSRDMVINNYFEHDSPTYGTPFDMMHLYGITYQVAGENIASGYTSPEEVVNAWMESPGHRANILNEDFTTIGVGYDEGSNAWTQHFIK